MSSSPNQTEVVSSQEIRGSRKIIYVDVIENDKGRAVRMTEISNNKRNFIIIPPELVSEVMGAASRASADATS